MSFCEINDARLCTKLDICYAPDFLINAGGLINVYSEIKGYDFEKAMFKTQEIYNTTLEILNKANLLKITTHEAALMIAKERLNSKCI